MPGKSSNSSPLFEEEESNTSRQMTNSGMLPRVLTMILFLSAIAFSVKGSWAEEGGKHSSWVPVKSVEYRTIDSSVLIDGRPFQTCQKCLCCQGPKDDPSSRCLTMSCCYHLDCNLPGKPFGQCSFRPYVCNCHNCDTAARNRHSNP